jgi:hypothetical protein
MAKKKEPVLRWIEEPSTLPPALQYYPMIKSREDGPLPLCAAVHWIASRGLTQDCDLGTAHGLSVYCDVAHDMFAKIASSKLRAVGEDDDEKNVFIPAAEFVGLTPQFDFAEDFVFPSSVVKSMEINAYIGRESRDVFRKARNRGRWTGVYVFWEDLHREWPLQVIGTTRSSASLGKKPVIISFLRKKFPAGVPSPSEAPRKDLLGEIRDNLSPKHSSFKTLDAATLKKAIDEYNSELNREIRNSPN